MTSCTGCLGTSIAFDQGAEIRLLDHAAYIQRDGLNRVWVSAGPVTWTLLVLAGLLYGATQQLAANSAKGGRTPGIFTYTAFAPTRGIGAFVAINKFDFGAAMAMASIINRLIGELARADEKGRTADIDLI